MDPEPFAAASSEGVTLSSIGVNLQTAHADRPPGGGDTREDLLGKKEVSYSSL